MNYRVVYTERFHERVSHHVNYLLAEYVSTAIIMAWYDRLFDLLDGLDDIPSGSPSTSLLATRQVR